MSELPTVSGSEAIQALRTFGFEVVRIEGSHHILKKPGHRFNLSVPVHTGKSLKRGTLRRLIRDAGLTVEEFAQAAGR